MTDAPEGLLLFAHGARDPQWARPFEAVVAQCRSRAPQRPVRLAFLEFMAPTLPEAGAALAEAGCRVVDIVPLFLGAGGHVRKDIPLLMAQLSQSFPEVQWRLRSAVGEAPAVIEAMASVALAAASLPEVPVR